MDAVYVYEKRTLVSRKSDEFRAELARCVVQHRGRVFWRIEVHANVPPNTSEPRGLEITPGQQDASSDSWEIQGLRRYNHRGDLAHRHWPRGGTLSMVLSGQLVEPPLPEAGVAQW